MPEAQDAALFCRHPQAAQLCSDLHVFSYPTLRIFQDGKPANALNWVGPADHETLFLALLGWLGRQPEGKRAIAAFEASAQEQARPYVERMREARREIQAAASAPKGHHHPNISAAAASISAVRREALAAGVPGFALGLGKNGTGDEGAAKLPLHGNHNSYFEAGADGAEGCEVSGTLKLQRVPGTLRINAHAHYQSLEPGWVNLTHTVNTLLFAKTLNRSHVPHTAASFISSPVINATLLKAVAPLKEGRNMHPLHGQRFAARFRHSDLAHYLKVIPASFAFASGEEGELYLYTANNRFNVRPGETPSLSFGIDISPMRLLYSESHEEWTSFLTSTCAVIGGVFTVFGMVVAMLDTSSEAFAKKSI